MAFEVTYTYYERNEDGSYNTEESKTLTKRYGKRYEELPIEQVAAAIITQLSRRDIWVTDVEVFEFVRKKLKFREVNKGGGIILGNKKFGLDLSQSVVAEDEEQAQPQPPPAIQLPPQVIPKQVAVEQPQRWSFFDPPQELAQQASVLSLTKGKKYPIFEEKPVDFTNMNKGLKYRIRDDLNREVWASGFYFNEGAQLTFENEMMGGPDIRPRSTFQDSVQYESAEILDLRSLRR